MHVVLFIGKPCTLAIYFSIRDSLFHSLLAIMVPITACYHSCQSLGVLSAAFFRDYASAACECPSKMFSILKVHIIFAVYLAVNGVNIQCYKPY